MNIVCKVEVDMEARRKNALWLCILAVVMQGTVSETPPDYRECTLGKGQARLYNCGTIYDINSTGMANLTKFQIPARYLVKLKNNETSKTVDQICDRAVSGRSNMYSGSCIYKYTRVWLGMLMIINGGNLSELLTKEAASVDHVEIDGMFRVCGSIVQGNPPSWGLDRIDHLPGQNLLNGIYASTATGTGVHVYVLDTGIRCSHTEFRYQDGRLNKTTGKPLSRCLDGFDGIKDGKGTNDCNGHGTHCAGIVGGLRTGVAKDVFFHPVRIMGCDGTGTFGAFLAGLDWVSLNLIRPAVLSMSIATEASISVDQAISNMVNTSGVLVIAAAGNFLQEACNYSPARAAAVLTVGSSNCVNEISWFSNYGSCTAMFAPGELVYSSYSLNDTSYATLSGTSMACPHVAGAAALYLGQNPNAKPVEIKQSLMDATEAYALSTTNLKPGTTTKLLNTNTKQPFFNISSRFLAAPENSIYPVVINLLMKPASTVFLTPIVDPTIGYFMPKLIMFPPDIKWSKPQTTNLVLSPNTDFLDHSASIYWIFSSKDTRFEASPEGSVTAQDTDVCKRTANYSCGQTVDMPKIIPSLPFYYIDDSSPYQNIYDESFDANCHSNGPDLFFQYTPPVNTFVNISLCGATTQFDTILSIYDYKKLERKGTLTVVACNDDYCGLKSMLVNVPLLAGHLYIIMIDGFLGGGGPLELYMYAAGSPLVPSLLPVPTSIPVMVSRLSASNQSTQVMCTLWENNECEPAPAPLPIQADVYWSPVGWGPCDMQCGGGLQRAVMECFTGDYSLVDSWNCGKIPVPLITQVCNMVVCSSYTIVDGPWHDCSHSCGVGTRKRQVTCMDSMGNTAHPDKCGGEHNFVMLQECDLQACNDTHWESPSWDYCNVPCEGGMIYRDSLCYSNGVVVNAGMCNELRMPRKARECNTQPCQTYAWLVGPWDACHLDNTNYRVVECVDGGGEKVSDAFCDPKVRPKTMSPCQQSSLISDFCAYNNCSNNGLCKNGSCFCSTDWEGHYCERPVVCVGNPMGVLADETVSCCPYSTIDVQQNCCVTPGAKIDADGACCNGTLDACGICNGPHMTLCTGMIIREEVGSIPDIRLRTQYSSRCDYLDWRITEDDRQSFVAIYYKKEQPHRAKIYTISLPHVISDISV